MTLHPFPPIHLPELMSWFPDERSLRSWGGPEFRFPFNESTFRTDAKLEQLASWALVEPSGTLAGFGQYYRRLRRCHLGRLAIRPALRGQRLGEILVLELARLGKAELGLEACSLFVLADNAPALRLYRRLGFVVETYPDPMPGLDDALFMVATALPEPSST